jgi:hypothetical protein
MDKAKDAFKERAAHYCAKGKCPDNEHCTATVTNLSVENQGVGSTPVPNHPEQFHCFIKFKVTGNIACNCSAKGA